MTKNKRLSPVWYFVIVNNVAVVLIILSIVLGVAGFVIAKATYQEKYEATALLFVCKKDDTSPDAYSQTRATSEQEITATSGKTLRKVTVAAVTAAIDDNITAGNIKDGVTILGVTGTYDGT